MILSSQNVGLYDHQYLWKEYMNIFLFLHGDVHQEKITCEVTVFGWACPGMTNHAQACVDFPGEPLG